MSGRRWLALAVTLVALATVATSIAIHPPGAFRADRLDQRRGDDLLRLSGQVGIYWRARHQLPPNLAALAADQGLEPRGLRDPESGEPYRYGVSGDTDYRLCATVVHPDHLRERHSWARTVEDSGKGWACYKFTVGSNGR